MIEQVKKQIPEVFEPPQEAKPIESSEEFDLAMDRLLQNKGSLESLTESKDKITKPINEALKYVRGQFEPPIKALTKVVDADKSALALYKDKINHDLSTALAKSRGEPEAMKIIIEDLAKTSYRRDDGTVTFRELVDFEVTDWRKVPIDCLKLDETKIRALAKVKDKIPGILLKQKRSVAISLSATE